MNTNINEILSISIVGVALSGLVQYMKAVYGTSGFVTKAFTVLLAFAVGGLYVWIRETPYFVTFITVLTSASTVYALFLKK